MKRCLTIITICVFSLFLGGCTLFPSVLRGMEALSMVTAADSSRGEGPVRMSGSGATIADAAEDAAAHAAEEKVFCAHTGYVLLGEESAREDVTALLRWVCRSREIRMDVPLLIVRGASAEQALLESGSERVGAAELLDAIASSAPERLGGELPSVARIAGRLESGGCAFAAAVACTPSSELEGGERPMTLAPAGLAVLKEGKLAAFLDPDDAVGADLLLGARGVHSFVVTDRPHRIGDPLVLDVATTRSSYSALEACKPGYQAANIACAVCLAEDYLGRAIDPEKLRAAVASCPTPGRFQLLRQEPPVLIDACHNPQSVETFLTAVRAVEPEASGRPLLLCAVLADKDVRGIVEILAREFPRVACTRTSSHRALPAEELAALFREAGADVVGVYPTVEDAVEALEGEAYVACGSITLAGAVAGILA